ncbi:MAG: hypothetical protein J5842_05375, partial [Lachnospiraceae bacterium]|nr:hypothetical protein [Lachnospiraceae bacterium]
YPAMALVYFLRYEDKKKALLSFIYMTLSCVLMAAGFFIYCLPVSGVSLSGFLSEIPNVFSDGTHSLLFADKLVLYARQWSVVIKHGVIFLAASLICMGFIRIIRKKRADIGFLRELACWVMLVSSLLMLAAPIAGIKLGPFHFQSRLLVIYLLMWADMLFGKKEKGVKALLQSRAGFMVFTVMMLSAVSFAGVLIFSNVGPDSSSSYLTHGLAAGLLLIYHRVSSRGNEQGSTAGENAEIKTDNSTDSSIKNCTESGRETEKASVYEKSLFTASAAVFILSLLMCRGFYVRYTEYFPSDITQKREAVSQGPLAGVYLLPEDALTEKTSRSMIENATKALTKSDAKAMLLGTDQIHDLEMACRMVCPSTISTPAFNEQWISYFEKKPELLPDIVFIAKNTIDDREKFFEKNVFGQYLAKRYDTENMQENDAMCMIVRKAE